jgi:hypothetical protein
MCEQNQTVHEFSLGHCISRVLDEQRFLVPLHLIQSLFQGPCQLDFPVNVLWLFQTCDLTNFAKISDINCFLQIQCYNGRESRDHES